MQYISLTHSKFALIDDEDFELANRFKWYVGDKGYARTVMYMGTIGGKVKNVIMYLHQLIIRAPQGMEVDHRNHIKLDCRRENIRICTKSQNMQNQIKTRGSSKWKGVHWCKRDAKWRAQIGPEGKRIHLGYFNDETDAALAYNLAAQEHFGEFACLNEVTSCS